MKKVILMFCMAICLFATNAFAQMQEVRGVETRRVVYNGPEYKKYSDTYTEYYGFEFHNMNSVSVSVDIELYLRETATDGWGNKKQDILIATKTIVLKPNEIYLYKRESDCDFRVYCYYLGIDIDRYYVTYKAYKLL